MKKILVPIDFTPYSINALKFASYIAKVKGMSIKLLHIVEEPRLMVSSNIPMASTELSKHAEEIEKHTREHLKRLVDLEGADATQAEYEVRKSKLGVTKEILKEECDVIIMGRRRAENDEVFFLGTTAEKTIRLSPVPVITIGDLPKDYKITEILFASDFEDEELGPVIQRVIDLSKIFKANLRFLYVSLNREFNSIEKSYKDIEQRISKFEMMEGYGVEVYVADTQEAGINQFIVDKGINLLTLATHGRSGLANFFVGSVAENLATYVPVPVITYNINKKLIERVSRPVTREKIILRRKSGEKK